MPTYPVIAEFWSALEGTLQLNAKKLVEDIAKQNSSDPKALWALIKPQIKIELADIEVPENLQVYCAFPVASEGAIKVRCRAPCCVGFEACPKHIGKKIPPPSNLIQVDSVVDSSGKTYYVNTTNNIIIDKNGATKGILEDNSIFLFETDS